MRESSEPGVANIVVRAFDQNGTVLGQSTTDQAGNYMIDYLGKNNYYLEFDMPLGFTMTTPNMGNDDTMDSDIDNSNGPSTTKWYNIIPGEHMPNVDAGVIYGVLPVTWTDVWGEHRDSHNFVEWILGSEHSVSHYEVEKSLNSTDAFRNIGQVLSKGDSSGEVSYDFEDYDVYETGIYYYRIKQIDLDGRFDYSDIVAINVESDTDEHEIDMYPNPVVNEVTIELGVTKAVSDMSIDVFNAEGKLVRKNLVMDLDLSPGSKKYKMNVSQMAKGVYSVHVNLDNDKIVKKLIIVSN